MKVPTCYLQATTIIAGFLCDYVTAIDMHSHATGAPRNYVLYLCNSLVSIRNKSIVSCVLTGCDIAASALGKDHLTVRPPRVDSGAVRG